MSNSVLLVGLGNPGDEYAATRHNAGQWWLDLCAESLGARLKAEKKFHGMVGQGNCAGVSCVLLFPTTYMNRSGQSVRAVADYYNISTDNIFVAHDELDLPPGRLKLKIGGGHAGHNGLRDMVSHLPNADFKRIRIGIGHPGHKDRVHKYVLSRANKHDMQLIEDACAEACALLPELVTHQTDRIMQSWHQKSE